jgi:hypothetical protein
MSPSVTVIPARHFRECASIAAITFGVGSRVSRLEGHAFHQTALTSIHFPASIEVIYEKCFAGCRSLTFIDFAAGSRLQRIEDGAFASIVIVELTLPGGLISLSGSAFDVEQLDFVSFSPPSANFRVDEGLIRDGSVRQLIRLFGKVTESSVSNCIENICEKCFSGLQIADIDFVWPRIEIVANRAISIFRERSHGDCPSCLR